MDFPFHTHMLIPLGIFFMISFMQSITGFGLVIVATPLLMMVYDVKQVVLIVQIASMVINLMLGLTIIKDADKNLIFLLFIGALLGQPLGLLLYDYFSSDTLRIGISALILCSLAMMHLNKRAFVETSLRTGFVGFICGTLNAATGIGGPPLILYLAQTNRTPKKLRATTVIFFSIINIAIVTRFYLAGRDLNFAATQVFYAIPAVIIGLVLGNIAFKHVSPPLFKKMLFIMIALASTYTICTSLVN